MILFFKNKAGNVYAAGFRQEPTSSDISKLSWVFGNATYFQESEIKAEFIGPRKEMITPWSTNAVEITQNMGIEGITRIEEYFPAGSVPHFDPMLQAVYHELNQDIFTIVHEPEPIKFVENLEEYNRSEGLALSTDEIEYLSGVSRKIGRPLTDSEVFGFSQVNSEHCRHKIFNGTFIIDGKEMPESLFAMIKKTSRVNPNRLVSAYSDNVAFIDGPAVLQFAPETSYRADFFQLKEINTIISLKAETHNFPTTVEPFNGAATGSGGEIRDRMAGGKGSLPLAGTAVYMTSYPRLGEERDWENTWKPRKWLYQTPAEILIKASNGASDFGNKFGQPLICGSVLTFEHEEAGKTFGYDKVVMLAGGIGYGRKEDAGKEIPSKDDLVVVMGGDNYRIGMGGGAVSSVATGEFSNQLELNAVQRSNPEMQKRVANALRAMCEMDKNPVISVHDHGAGGHLNSISELVEATGGIINIDQLPVGDPTLSAKEIIGNESQERMGLVISPEDFKTLRQVSERERAPVYIAGEVTGDRHLKFSGEKYGTPVDIELEYLFGKPPKTVISDSRVSATFEKIKIDPARINHYLSQILQLESVACKDWLTNKVDRSVTGRVALQQCTGEIQLPLNNLGISALDYTGFKGIATSLGHAPAAALIDPEAGSVLSIAEALTNIAWAPLEKGLKGISLSANWMWPAKNPGEDDRLYRAVKAVSDFSIELGINVPTGKDSLSMTQKYPDGSKVFSPGTVIITAVAEVTDFRKVVTPVIKNEPGTSLIYIDFSGSDYETGGSAIGQVVNKLGEKVPQIISAEYFARCFKAVQHLVEKEEILAGHDISAGGLITAMLEMNFPNTFSGMEIDLSGLNQEKAVLMLFSENPAVIIQVKETESVEQVLKTNQVGYQVLGRITNKRKLQIKHLEGSFYFDINELRDVWYKTSYLLDINQCGEHHAKKRFKNYKKQALSFRFPADFSGTFQQFGIRPDRIEKTGIKAAIIREKGVNGDREMAFMMHLAGFDVKDVHMTDLISGREDLTDVNMIVFVGGFSNSDVLGSGKGWAGAFLFNEKAKTALDNFFKRDNTLSLGVCNGCQVMVELGLINPDHIEKPKMVNNDSHKFESGFVNVDIKENNSVMLKNLAGSRLGIWVAHGEGKYQFPYEESAYQIPMKYSFGEYPGNPNGSQYNAAALCSTDGRHLVMMPHLERAFYPHHWANYPSGRKADEVTPWIEAFVNAREWIRQNS